LSSQHNRHSPSPLVSVAAHMGANTIASW